MEGVVLVLSSSRGGSSIFAETLRQSRNLRHLPGEVNPFLRLVGLDRATGSDALGVEHASPEFVTLLERQVGVLAWPPPPDLAVRCLDRLQLQWPDVEFLAADVGAAVDASVGHLPDTARFTRSVITALAGAYPVHPGRYDIPLAPGEAAAAPLPARIVEEPPFIQLLPWRVTGGSAPVVLKSPSNAYRLPFFHRMFPDLRILHLTRNPASAVTGLLDGWRYPGFHAHDVGGLAIGGYSEVEPGGDRWWKYDLPPGWDRYRAASLGEVCAFQWESAHAAILAWRAQHPEVPALDLRFEDFLADPLAVVTRACAWVGVDVDPPLRRAAAEGLPPVMATSRPRQRRWFDRAAEIEPLLERVADTTAALGYRDRDEWL